MTAADEPPFSLFLAARYPLLLLPLVHQQRNAHENPVIFYSVILGCVGPVLVLTVPPIRERLGYKKAEMVPTSYPCEYSVILSHTSNAYGSLSTK